MNNTRTQEFEFKPCHHGMSALRQTDPPSMAAPFAAARLPRTGKFCVARFHPLGLS